MSGIRPVIVGASYRTVPSGTRDKLYLDRAARQSLQEKLRRDGIDQALILSTCDRVEVLICSPDGEPHCQQVQRHLAAHAGLSFGKISDLLYRLYDDEAVSHLFTVICALDSHMIGEAQIFGQVKEAITESQEADMIGTELADLSNSAVALAKRVRSQTRIGEGAISVASAAVRLARDLHGNLADCRALLIGLGETGLLLREQMQLAGLTGWMMAGSARRTERMAAKIGAHFTPTEQLPAALEQADLVVTAAGNGRYLIDVEMAETIIRARRRKPVLFLDCGIPADIDPGLDALDDVFLYGLSDIEQLAEKGQLDRQEAAEEARQMVREAVGDYRRIQAEKDGIPMLVTLRRHFELIRANLLADHPNASAEEATRLLVNRLLHQPSEALRALAGQGDAADLRDTITVNRVLEQLFDLAAQADNQDKNQAIDKMAPSGEKE
ncbi:glutamyl-tRNA reductase [Aestuariispira insulae]|uniref:Glutamyl-tRNA reductase n=1 Tax=Aestuariispira insulae TaxID=1461337 RepID=A0A3D9HF15_9PROT|nr:glutamyl-tRNA reductase [Aestuariispira insulae]RED48063.1 glutamyl-tRNA reductase [Aestuariispira insulae]